MKFSLVYPTRNRPRFIEVALEFLEHETYPDFEVIVSDNYTDPSLSCEKFCKSSSLKNIKYVRPTIPLGMVANWNYALEHAKGDYILFFTDKMFLLPGTLEYVADVLRENPAEIINWVDNKFTPLQFPNYFEEGVYTRGTPGIASNKRFELFDPKEELKKKAFAAVSRGEQSASHYARGKICFGAYDRRLIARILSHAGKLFYNLSPDYTSMILGLSYANSAMEIGRPGIVHVNTDLSNGGQGAIRDDHALAYLNSLADSDSLFGETLIPNLYSSVHNNVAHDYIALKRRLNLEYELNRVNWLVYITEDLDLPSRVWSSPQIEFEHRELLKKFIEEKLSVVEREQYFSKLELRTSARDAAKSATVSGMVKDFFRLFIPNSILEMRRQHRGFKQELHPASTQIRLYDLLQTTPL